MTTLKVQVHRRSNVVRVATGIRGPKGEASTVAGPQGAPGIQGPSGPRGVAGPEGEPGLDGVSPELPDNLVFSDDPRLTGFSQEQHAALRTLTHWAENGPYESYSGAHYEQTGASRLFPDSATWWTDSNKTTRLMDEELEYNVNHTVATHRIRIFDPDGQVLVTATDHITYDGLFETGRERLIS